MRTTHSWTLNDARTWTNYILHSREPLLINNDQLERHSYNCIVPVGVAECFMGVVRVARCVPLRSQWIVMQSGEWKLTGNVNDVCCQHLAAAASRTSRRLVWIDLTRAWVTLMLCSICMSVFYNVLTFEGASHVLWWANHIYKIYWLEWTKSSRREHTI